MPPTRQRTRSTITVPTTAAMLVVTVALLAGCGGSAPSKGATEQGRATPAQSVADVGQTSVQTSGAQNAGPRSSLKLTDPGRSHRDPVHRTGIQKSKATPAESNDDITETPRPQFNPCSLVSTSEAQAIIGGAISGRVEAPLGPTCVYKLEHSKPDITLTVESLNLSQVTHEMAKPTTLMLGHHRAYCGRWGTQMLFAPLPKGQVLNVTAPCAIAQQFAALALPRLTA